MFWLKRILLDSSIVLMILFLPWWIGLLSMIWLFWKYDLPEILFFALLMDVLYSSFEATRNIAFPYLNILMPTDLFAFDGPLSIPIPLFTIILALLMYILNLLKKRIRFNE